MARTEIKISGYGGQGVIMSGYIVGKAASIFDTKNATMTQSFGPEARGSACSSQVVIEDGPVLYPYVTQPQVLVAMSQEAYAKFEPELAGDGMLLIDEDLVRARAPRERIRLYGIPATRLAEELGRKIVLNIIMVGFFTALAGVVGEEAARRAVLDSIPKGTEDLNLKAFERGLAYGKELLARQQGETAPAAGESGEEGRQAAAS